MDHRKRLKIYRKENLPWTFENLCPTVMKLFYDIQFEHSRFPFNLLTRKKIYQEEL